MKSNNPHLTGGENSLLFYLRTSLKPWKGCKFHVGEMLLCRDHFAWQLQGFICLGATFSWQAQYF